MAPKPLDEDEALEEAKGYYERWFPSALAFGIQQILFSDEATRQKRQSTAINRQNASITASYSYSLSTARNRIGSNHCARQPNDLNRS